ncbi:hypothetical protein ACYCMJ_21385, partial [Escherichia coli]
MLTSFKLHSLKPYSLKSSMILEIITYILCFFSMIIAFVDNTFSDPASIISLCRCTLENSNAPLSLL